MGWPGPMTERQFITWQAWLREEYNNPSRADYYAMEVARACGAKNVKPLKLVESIVERSTEEQVADAKARAIARGGGKVIRVTKVRDGNDGAGG